MVEAVLLGHQLGVGIIVDRAIAGEMLPHSDDAMLLHLADEYLAQDADGLVPV